jgi:hypothetical protein
MIGSTLRFGIYVEFRNIAQICEIRPPERNSFFEVVNVAADFSALEAKCGNHMAVGHAPNLGADPIHFLWQLRHNTGFNHPHFAARACG